MNKLSIALLSAFSITAVVPAAVAAEPVSPNTIIVTDAGAEVPDSFNLAHIHYSATANKVIFSGGVGDDVIKPVAVTCRETLEKLKVLEYLDDQKLLKDAITEDVATRPLRALFSGQTPTTVGEIEAKAKAAVVEKVYGTMISEARIAAGQCVATSVGVHP